MAFKLKEAKSVGIDWKKPERAGYSLLELLENKRMNDVLSQEEIRGTETEAKRMFFEVSSIFGAT